MTIPHCRATGEMSRAAMVCIIGHGILDGVDTGIWQLIRAEPQETMIVRHGHLSLHMPTLAEILRVKGVLILKSNALRGCYDFAALARQMDIPPCRMPRPLLIVCIRNRRIPPHGSS